MRWGCRGFISMASDHPLASWTNPGKDRRSKSRNCSVLVLISASDGPYGVEQKRTVNTRRIYLISRGSTGRTGWISQSMARREVIFTKFKRER